MTETMTEERPDTQQPTERESMAVLAKALDSMLDTPQWIDQIMAHLVGLARWCDLLDGTVEQLRGENQVLQRRVAQLEGRTNTAEHVDDLAEQIGQQVGKAITKALPTPPPAPVKKKTAKKFHQNYEGDWIMVEVDAETV